MNEEKRFHVGDRVKIVATSVIEEMLDVVDVLGTSRHTFEPAIWIEKNVSLESAMKYLRDIAKYDYDRARDHLGEHHREASSDTT